LLKKSKTEKVELFFTVPPPPKKGTGIERLEEIASRQIQRLQSLNIDGLILYDIQDEKSRTTEKRPFSFMGTLDAFSYSEDYLRSLTIPKIIYRSVGKYGSSELSEFLRSASPEKN
jgi:hypothetical protein